MPAHGMYSLVPGQAPGAAAGGAGVLPELQAGRGQHSPLLDSPGLWDLLGFGDSPPFAADFPHGADRHASFGGLGDLFRSGLVTDQAGHAGEAAPPSAGRLNNGLGGHTGQQEHADALLAVSNVRVVLLVRTFDPLLVEEKAACRGQTQDRVCCGAHPWACLGSGLFWSDHAECMVMQNTAGVRLTHGTLSSGALYVKHEQELANGPLSSGALYVKYEPELSTLCQSTPISGTI